jgi:hypothetical protein
MTVQKWFGLADAWLFDEGFCGFLMVISLGGGKVQVDSTVGKGTTVICEFPTDQAVQRDAAE